MNWRKIFLIHTHWLKTHRTFSNSTQVNVIANCKHSIKSMINSACKVTIAIHLCNNKKTHNWSEIYVSNCARKPNAEYRCLISTTCVSVKPKLLSAKSQKPFYIISFNVCTWTDAFSASSSFCHLRHIRIIYALIREGGCGLSKWIWWFGVFGGWTERFSLRAWRVFISVIPQVLQIRLVLFYPKVRIWFWKKGYNERRSDEHNIKKNK